MAEIRSLKAHNKLLLDVIRRQAGSLDKAVLEGVMNAIEAGSSRVDINFTEAQEESPAILRIVDTGRGIQTEQEIQDWFETFGQPHEESEGKIWAQFRMGRGQIFSFGRTIWRTSTFKMTVDIEKNGLDYHFEKGLPAIDGCDIQVEIYLNPIPYHYRSIHALLDAIKRQIEFIAVPVYFNGELLSRDPQKLKWDAEDENAYYLWGVGNNLVVYNLGALVCDFSGAEMGVTGVIVSKRQLKVNFARNNIQHDCPIWNEILPVIRANRVKRTRRVSARLNSDERIATLRALRDGEESYENVKQIALFETSSGRALNLTELARRRAPWTFAPTNNQIADKLMQSDQALCLDESILHKLNYTGRHEQFWMWLFAGDHIANRFANMARFYCPFEKLSNGYREFHTILSPNKLTKAERRVLRVLDGICRWGRSLCIGISDTANGWTDGCSYIAIGRDYLSRNWPTTTRGASAILGLIVHELAHNTCTEGSHVHGLEFYRAFHDFVRENHPFQRVPEIVFRMKSARHEDHQAEIEARKQREQKKRDRKLGLGVAAEAKTGRRRATTSKLRGRVKGRVRLLED